MLHAGFGTINGDTCPEDTRFVYIYRTCEKGVPKMWKMSDAKAEMPNYFLIGSFQSNILESMVQTMREVMKLRTLKRYRI